jgi:hypothetical protein
MTGQRENFNLTFENIRYNQTIDDRLITGLFCHSLLFGAGENTSHVSDG